MDTDRNSVKPAVDNMHVIFLREKNLLDKIRTMRLKMEQMQNKLVVLECENEQLRRKSDFGGIDMGTQKLIKQL